MINKNQFNVVFIGIGSNIKNRFQFISSAVDKINSSKKCKVILASSIYISKPLGNLEQNNFLNLIIKVKTKYEPIELFEFLKDIEKDLGRKNRSRWSEREIDLDIIFFNNLIYKDKTLSIPHSEILKRDFVYLPLLEIEPDIIHPFYNKKISDICKRNKSKFIIRKYSRKIMAAKN